MESYQWQGVTLGGKHCSGTDQAYSVEDLKKLLYTRDIGLLSVKPAQKVSLFSSSILRSKDKIAFFEHVAILLESGVGMAAILEILGRQANGLYKQKVTLLLERLLKGFSLAAAAKQEGIFSHLEQELMLAAEKTGQLVVVLRELAGFIMQKNDLKKHIARAVFVPIVTLLVALVVVCILSHVVLPGFESLFSSMDKDIPTLSKYLFFIASLLRMIPISALMGIILIGLLCLRAQKLKQYVLRQVFWLMWHIPFFQSCMIHYYLYHYLQAVRLYAMSGAPFEQALKKGLAVVSDSPYKKILAQMLAYVQQGYAPSDAAQKIGRGFVPDECITLLVVAEQSGSMVAMLQRACFLLDYTLKQRLGILTRSIGPAMLILVGGVVSLVMVAVYIPIFSAARMF